MIARAAAHTIKYYVLAGSEWVFTQPGVGGEPTFEAIVNERLRR
jgi:hypothetical protein